MSSEDTGDSSSQGGDSPYSSPSQQVPYVSNLIMGLSCGDNNMDTGCGPFLIITEQPNDHFRFRYVSELVGTHGCIIGKSSNSNRTKTFPSVELMNYTGKAIIKCRLAQFNNPMDHPHKLVEDEHESDVRTEVNAEKGYGVTFQGMGIIHMAKKDVPVLLYKKLSESRKTLTEKQLKHECEVMAKKINLNIVRLKFSAHNIDTDEEICPPVFSEPIHNMKSAATNDLKICRMSRSSGKPRGGEDVFIFTEKVNKKNIEIRFIELNQYGETIWTEKGRFLQSDVHHQYGIVFRTPRYKNPEITSNVKVYVELFRPTDGRTSERLEFTYTPEEVFKQCKKRKNNSFNSFGSSSSGSLKSIEQDQIPRTVVLEQFNVQPEDAPMPNITINFPHVPQLPLQMENSNDLSAALFSTLTQDTQGLAFESPQMQDLSPMLGQPNVPVPPHDQFVSGDIEKLLEANMSAGMNASINEVEMESFFNDVKIVSNEYFRPVMSDMGSDMGFLNYSINLKADSGRGNGIAKQQIKTEPLTNYNDEPKLTDTDYKAYYNKEDGEEVKKLVKELCDMIRHKAHFRKQVARNKLERLFELRLSNGDTFLHLTLHNHMLPSMEYIVKLIHSLNMTHLLNEKNDRLQTILHQAVINDLPTAVAFLVSKGCDPMAQDIDDNNVVHYAVICQSCLAPLLDSIKQYNVPCDLNAVNKDKHTALHLAVTHRSERSAGLLIAGGAAAGARDAAGRTPLHVAAYDASLAPAKAILAHAAAASEVDALDGQGNTALQIVCGSQPTEQTLAFVELLLNNGADPLRNEPYTGNESAWNLARGNTQIRELMRQYVPATRSLIDDDIKSEPEEEFESADEGDSPDTGLEAMSAYIHELSDILDRAGTWRQLAARLQCDSLLNWYEKTPSPTRTLLSQVKECQEEVTSIGLAKILRDMGEFEAANVILRYVDV